MDKPNNTLRKFDAGVVLVKYRGTYYKATMHGYTDTGELVIRIVDFLGHGIVLLRVSHKDRADEQYQIHPLNNRAKVFLSYLEPFNHETQKEIVNV